MAIRPRAAGAVAAAVSVLLLAACGNVPEPTLAAPDSAGEVLAGPPSIVAPPPSAAPTSAAPTTGPPTTTPRATPGATPKPRVVRAAAPAQPGPEWHRVGGDEFDGPSLDTDTWNRYDSVGGFGNGYRRPEAISQAKGRVRISGRGDVSGGMAYGRGQLYGRWEFRARTEAGRGYGSAILLWPDSEKWPDDGEVDMMEVPGENRDLAHFVLHYTADNKLMGSSHRADYTQWHTFAVDWLPDRVTWYVDGVQRFTTTDPAMIPTKPMHMTIQLDMGPWQNWIPARDETTPAEVGLEVDWVRIYQR